MRFARRAVSGEGLRAPLPRRRVEEGGRVLVTASRVALEHHGLATLANDGT